MRKSGKDRCYFTNEFTSDVLIYMEQNPPAPPVAAKTSNLAVWSLVLGCMGLVGLVVCAGPLFAIAGVICGHLALRQIKKTKGAMPGRGLAVAGLVTSYLSIGVSIIGMSIILFRAAPHIAKVRSTTPVDTCINNLRKIDIAKQTCAMEKKLTSDQTPSAEDLKPYLGQDFSTLHCPEGGHYTINNVAETPTCTIPGHVLTREPTR